jgi:transposase-like protein
MAWVSFGIGRSRALDSASVTLDALLSATPDAAPGERFLRKVMGARHKAPEVTATATAA